MHANYSGQHTRIYLFYLSEVLDIVEILMMKFLVVKRNQITISVMMVQSFKFTIDVMMIQQITMFT